MKMVGWGVDNGVKYWKVANSWNPYWGEKGYFRIKKGNNEGGIEDQVTQDRIEEMNRPPQNLRASLFAVSKTNHCK